jgi:hypothetical protein
MQLSQTPHGSAVGLPLPDSLEQFKTLDIILAVVVLPIPLMPVSKKALAMRLVFTALVIVCTRKS